MNLAPDEQRVLAAVESVLGPLVAEGRARLDVSPAAGSRGALIEIKPTRESACPVTIHCEAPGDLDLYVGRHKLTTHIWKTRQRKRGDFAALEDELREWLTALIAGRFEEEVQLTHDGDAGEGRGRLELLNGPWRFKYSNAPTLGKRGPSQTVAYTAY
jgi:hypothetical protein